ncbi:MAG: hypothetical protein P4L45_08920 [Ignavibacteriaceae bacterium]|nr:hypothetical protein [Ignavibacteriaceae bacterium]
MEELKSKITLENLLKDKLHCLIANSMEASQPVLDLIQKETTLLKDHFLPISQARFLIKDSKRLQIELNNSCYFLNANANVQLAGQIGLPSAWVNNMIQSEISWRTVAMAELLNRHVQNITCRNALVRTIGDEARAVLSGRYTRLDSQRLYVSFIEALRNAGARLFNAAISEDGLKVYFYGIYENIFEVQTSNGVIYLTVGVRLSHSDYSLGYLSLRTYLLQVLGANGLVMENLIKNPYPGTSASGNGNGQNNLLPDTLACSSRIQDILKYIFSKNRISDILSRVRKALETEINYADKIKTLENRVSKEEVKELNKLLAANRVEDGIGNTDGRNLWKLAQGLATVARDKAVSQKIRLEQIAGSLF